MNVYITWQNGIKLRDGIKFTNQMTLTQGSYPGLSGWAIYNQKVP